MKMKLILFILTSINYCLTAQDVKVMRNEKLEVKLTSVSCYGKNDGIIEIVSNLKELTEFKLINEGLNKIVYDFSPLKKFEYLTADKYILAYRDTSGQTNQINLVLSEPAQIKIDTFEISKPTVGDHDGNIKIYISGGSGIYKVKAYNTQVTYNQTYDAKKTCNILQLDNGIYFINVTDNKNCPLFEDKKIELPLKDNFAFAIEQSPRMCGNINAIWKIKLSNGTKPYKIQVLLNLNTILDQPN